MKKTKLFMTTLLIMLMSFMASINVLAVEERQYYAIKSGTATKLGTEEVHEVKKGYLEEWIISKEKIEGLDEQTKNKLIKAQNSNCLPLKEVTYETLVTLAEENVEDVEDVYQGYARLGLKDAADGYNYATCIRSSKDGYQITGYYVDLKGNNVYQIDLLCTKVTKQSVSVQYRSVVYSTTVSSTDSTTEGTSEPSNTPISKPNDTPIPSPTPTPEPEPEPEPEPTPTPEPEPTPPSLPPATGEPTVPEDVIPGVSEQNPLKPSVKPTPDNTPNNSPDTTPTLPTPPAPPTLPPASSTPTVPSEIIPGTSNN